MNKINAKELEKLVNEMNSDNLTVKSLVVWKSYKDEYGYHEYAEEEQNGKLHLDVYDRDDDLVADTGIDYDFEIDCNYADRIADKDDYSFFVDVVKFVFPAEFEIVNQYDENDCRYYFLKFKKNA